MQNVLAKEQAFFTAHQAEWTKLHSGRFAVVKGSELVGTFDTIEQALAAGAARFGLDSFLVRKLGEMEQEIHIPALTLGLLFANSQRSTHGAG